jgi:hypothetical protein
METSVGLCLECGKVIGFQVPEEYADNDFEIWCPECGGPEVTFDVRDGLACDTYVNLMDTIHVIEYPWRGGILYLY